MTSEHSIALHEHEEARAGRPSVRRLTGRGLGLFAGTALAVVALDQATKAAVRAWLERGEHWPSPGDGLLHISRVENSGAAFGILQGAGPFLLVTTALGVVAILAYLLFAPPAGRLYTAALASVLGGAVGNLVDRAARGTVTDFIDPIHYPAFNIADSAIVIGVGTLILLSFFDPSREAAGSGQEGR